MIVELDETHLESILSIERSSFREPWTRSMYRDELANPFSHTWGWFEDGGSDLMGYLTGWLLYEELHIANLAVHPDFRRRGVARKLLHHALAWGIEQGAEKALLEVRASNQPALDLYRGEGFHLIATRPRYYRSPTEDALVLQKRLG